MTSFRTEKDSMGSVKVPKDAYWGAQTQRSKNNFKIGAVKMPLELIYAHAIVKRSAALANTELKVLSKNKSDLIIKVVDEILAGKLDNQFPLVVFQTGSGTQTNMNLNEVIASRAHVLKGGKLTDVEKVLHPNDDVNKSQSTNDTFPTSIHIASYKILEEKTLPNLKKLQKSLEKKSKEFQKIVKIGRTHFMDATPLTLGQEFSSYSSQLSYVIKTIENSKRHLAEIPVGGTAVGTGLNTPRGYASLAVKNISKFTGFPFKPAKNCFESMASKDAIVELSSALKVAAVSLMKIANDIRMLGSGPRSGIGEIILPANEPGSSIMPGKVNPTQCEALTQVCAQVMGNDMTISIAGMSGQFQLNAFMPIIAHNIIESLKILGDTCESFCIHCTEGIQANNKQIQKHVDNSLMLVTALNTHIGYENAAKIAKKAYEENLTLKESAIRLKLVSEKDFDTWVDAKKML
ncbi:class II fumarate hydratase [Candidatus Peregrinibacteria bacterium]|jgi:fumarate hydratase, class II|nr:class II fumarate hydratase [Candidatus Peregrinibacteria bacterium]